MKYSVIFLPHRYQFRHYKRIYHNEEKRNRREILLFFHYYIILIVYYIFKYCELFNIILYS